MGKRVWKLARVLWWLHQINVHSTYKIYNITNWVEGKFLCHYKVAYICNVDTVHPHAIDKFTEDLISFFVDYMCISVANRNSWTIDISICIPPVISSSSSYTGKAVRAARNLKELGRHLLGYHGVQNQVTLCVSIITVIIIKAMVEAFLLGKGDY